MNYRIDFFSQELIVLDIIKFMARTCPHFAVSFARKAVVSVSVAIVMVAALALPMSASAQKANKIRLIRDAETENIIRQIATPLFIAAGLEPSSVRILLVDDNKLNAFVAGGQNIFLHTGLIIQSETPDALVGVIAHETGHIQGGHLIRRRSAIEQAQMLGAISAILGTAAAIGTGRGDVASAVILGGQGSTTRSFLKFSRTQESSADQAAFRLLDATGNSAKGLENFLGKIKDQELLSPRLQDPYMQTHPLSSARISAIRNHIEKSPNSDAQASKQTTADFDRMVAKLFGFIKPFNQVMQRYPKSDEGVPARYARAIAHYRKADVDRSVEIMDSLIKEQPANPYFYEMKGQILFENARAIAALPNYKKAYELQPHDALLALELARVELELEDPALLQDAIKHFRASLAIEPDSAFVWRQLGIAYGRAGNMPMSYLALSEEALRKNNLADAERLADKALKSLPNGSLDRIRARDVIETVKVKKLQGGK